MPAVRPGIRCVAICCCASVGVSRARPCRRAAFRPCAHGLCVITAVRLMRRPARRPRARRVDRFTALQPAVAVYLLCLVVALRTVHRGDRLRTVVATRALPHDNRRHDHLRLYARARPWETDMPFLLARSAALIAMPSTLAFGPALPGGDLCRRRTAWCVSLSGLLHPRLRGDAVDLAAASETLIVVTRSAARPRAPARCCCRLRWRGRGHSRAPLASGNPSTRTFLGAGPGPPTPGGRRRVLKRADGRPGRAARRQRLRARGRLSAAAGGRLGVELGGNFAAFSPRCPGRRTRRRTLLMSSLPTAAGPAGGGRLRAAAAEERVTAEPPPVASSRASRSLQNQRAAADGEREPMTAERMAQIAASIPLTNEL